MKKWSVNLPVPLDGTCNFRELGGYPANEGTIKKGGFYRSDALNRLSEDDLSWMEEKKITYSNEKVECESSGSAGWHL